MVCPETGLVPVWTDERPRPNRAVDIALARLTGGEWDWQYHPLCDILGGHDAIALVRPTNFMGLGWIE